MLSEVLYKARVDPFKTLEEIDDSQKAVLLDKIITTASDSYEAQGYTRTAGGSYRSVSGYKGRFELEVYNKKVCPLGHDVVRCEGPHGRSLWFVPEVIET